MRAAKTLALYEASDMISWWFISSLLAGCTTGNFCACADGHMATQQDLITSKANRLCEHDRTARLSSGLCLLLWRSQSWLVTRNSCSKMIATLRQHLKTGVEFRVANQTSGTRSRAFHTAATSRRSPQHTGCSALLQALSPVIPGRSRPLALMQALEGHQRSNCAG